MVGVVVVITATAAATATATATATAATAAFGTPPTVMLVGTSKTHKGAQGEAEAVFEDWLDNPECFTDGGVEVAAPCTVQALVQHTE